MVILSHICASLSRGIEQFLVFGFSFLMTPLVRGSSLSLSIERPVLACGCLKQDLGDFLGIFRIVSERLVVGRRSFLRRGEGQIAEG